MKHIFIGSNSTACFLVVSVLINSHALANDKSAQAIDLVEMFDQLGGKHPGLRWAHAKGLCPSGTFTPSPNKHLPRAMLLSNSERPVSMRF
jgi:catalase